MEGQQHVERVCEVLRLVGCCHGSVVVALRAEKRGSRSLRPYLSDDSEEHGASNKAVAAATQ